MGILICAVCWNPQIHNVPFGIFVSHSVNHHAVVLETCCCCNFEQYSFNAKNGGWGGGVGVETFSHGWKSMCLCFWCMDTNPEEWRITLSIVAHCKVVRLWPQNLHNVLVELCLFFLQRENLTVSSCWSLISSWQRQSTEPLRVIDAEEKSYVHGIPRAMPVIYITT